MIIPVDRSLHDLPRIDYRSLTELQGNLKDLTQRNYDKLKRSIVKHGFFVPAFVWHEGNKATIIDAHQRYRFLTQERATFDYGDGDVSYSMPYVHITAGTRAEAKEKLLIISSQYGQTTKDGFDEFVAMDFDEQVVSDVTTFDMWADPELPGNLTGEDKDKAPKVSITFATVEDLQAATPEIELLIQSFPKSYYSVSAGEI